MALEFEGFEAPISAIEDVKANGVMEEVHGFTQDDLEKMSREDKEFLPIGLTDADAWENYTDDRLYEMDKMVRSWLKKTWYHRTTKGKMKTAVPPLFTFLYGRPPGPADSRTCAMMHRLLKYYCTRYTGKSTINNQVFSRVYHFSQYSCKTKRPYSLRLRIEEMEDGKDPFRLGPDDRRDKRKKPRRANSRNGKKQNGSGSKDGGHSSKS